METTPQVSGVLSESETSTLSEAFFSRGFVTFAACPRMQRWVEHARPIARAALAAPELQQWYRYERTWFAGVNALGNGPDGRIGDGPPLVGGAIDFLRDALGLTPEPQPGPPQDVARAQETFAWDAAQLSVCFPGYPQPMPGETEGQARFRRARDAAHIDGIERVGPERRRFLRECHGFLLGICLSDHPAGASPFVIYEGSHEMVRDALTARFAGLPADAWMGEDITAAYNAVRKEVFATCPRVEVAARPGEAYVMHRLAVHGMAPWDPTVSAAVALDGRMITYFRPEVGGPERWLTAQ